MSINPEDLRSPLSRFVQPQSNLIESAPVIKVNHVITFVSGLTTIDTVIPPTEAFHMIILIATTLQTPSSHEFISANGNFRRLIRTDIFKPMLFFYHPYQKTYWGGNLEDDQ